MEKPSYISLTNYFKGQANPEIASSVDHWAKENESEFQVLRTIWDTHGSLASTYEPNSAQAWENIDQRTARNFPMKWVSGIAASVLILIGIVWVFQEVGLRPGSSSQVYEALVEKNEIQLSDGTGITLSKGARLEVASGFGSDHRHVSLSGKAFFEVIQNAELPFEVHAEGMEVHVLGTSFQVASNDALADVVVHEGTVLVKAINQEVQLMKGERVELNRTNATLSKSTPVNDNLLAWTGILTFTNSSLKDLANEISDHYGVVIEVSEALQERRITAAFDNQPVAEVLEIIAASLHVNVDTLKVSHYRIE